MRCVRYEKLDDDDVTSWREPDELDELELLRQMAEAQAEESPAGKESAC